MRFDANNADDFSGGLEEVWSNTEIGREYLRDYHSEETFEEDFDLIRRTAVRVAGQELVTEDEIARALYLLIQAGHIKTRKTAPAPLEEVPADTRPKDKLGRPMSPKAIQWQQWERWCNDSKTSMREINALRDSDPAFREFYEHQRTLRLKEQPNDSFDPEVPAAVMPVGASPELEAFATAYNKVPAASLRPIGGIVTLNGTKYSVAAFNKLVEAAGAARLIF